MRKKLAAWRLLALAAMALIGTGFMSSSANAQGTDTATFQVLANVPDLCIISASGAMDFVDYDPFDPAPNDLGTTDVTVTCTPGTTYDVGLNDGDRSNRTMIATSGGLLSYELYIDFGRSTRWDDIGGTTTQGVGGPGFVAPPDNYTVYGQMPPGQAVTETGGYSDTIIATVSF
jgi:spore coat protein U-like protein